MLLPARARIAPTLRGRSHATVACATVVLAACDLAAAGAGAARVTARQRTDSLAVAGCAADNLSMGGLALIAAVPTVPSLSVATCNGSSVDCDSARASAATQQNAGTGGAGNLAAAEHQLAAVRACVCTAAVYGPAWSDSEKSNEDYVGVTTRLSPLATANFGIPSTNVLTACGAAGKSAGDRDGQRPAFRVEVTCSPASCMPTPRELHWAPCAGGAAVCGVDDLGAVTVSCHSAGATVVDNNTVTAMATPVNRTFHTARVTPIGEWMTFILPYVIIAAESIALFFS